MFPLGWMVSEGWVVVVCIYGCVCFHVNRFSIGEFSGRDGGFIGLGSPASDFDSYPMSAVSSVLEIDVEPGVCCHTSRADAHVSRSRFHHELVVDVGVMVAAYATAGGHALPFGASVTVCIARRRPFSIVFQVTGICVIAHHSQRIRRRSLSSSSNGNSNGVCRYNVQRA